MTDVIEDGELGAVATVAEAVRQRVDVSRATVFRALKELRRRGLIMDVCGQLTLAPSKGESEEDA